jgi:hypothetical protein
MTRNHPRQLLVEIPTEALNWPMPWYAKTIDGVYPVGEDIEVDGEWENSTDTVKIGDYIGYVFEDSEINLTDRVFDSEGKPMIYDDTKKYVVYNEVISEGDEFFGLELCDIVSVFRPYSEGQRVKARFNLEDGRELQGEIDNQTEGKGVGYDDTFSILDEKDGQCYLNGASDIYELVK